MPLTRHDYASNMRRSPAAPVRTFTASLGPARLLLRHLTVRVAVWIPRDPRIRASWSPVRTTNAIRGSDVRLLLT